MAKPTTAVAVKEETAVSTEVIDFSGDEGTGFEECDSSSFAIPFLRLLQAISPAAKKKDAAYVDGAEEGDFINTATNQLYKGEVTVIPCHYSHKYTEWAPDRGGFRGTHTASEYLSLNKGMMTDAKGKQFEGNLDTGNTLVDTREHYVIIINEDGSTTPALISISSSEIKKSKRWMTVMQGIRINGQVARMFSQMYRVSSVAESNDKGSWVGMKMEHIGQVKVREQYEAAKQFREMVRSGEAKVATDEESPF